MVTFRQLVTQLPTDVFVDCLPQSLPLLEVNLLILDCDNNVTPLSPGAVLQAVPLWTGQEAVLRPGRVPRDRGLAAGQVLRQAGGPGPGQQGGKVRGFLRSYLSNGSLLAPLILLWESRQSNDDHYDDNTDDVTDDNNDNVTQVGAVWTLHQHV